MKKKLLAAALAVVLVVSVALIAVGNYMVNYAIVRKDTPSNVAPDSVVSAEDASVIAANQAAIQRQTEVWLQSTEIERKTILSDDGLTLVGNIYWNEAASHKWLLGIHGYSGFKESYQSIASFFAAEGYHVLLPDLRAHGESEGTYIGMGWPDRLDVMKWIDLIVEIDPDAEIVLHGISMGGATVMMVSGEQLPDNVKGIIEDCGYTSVWDIFEDELEYLFHLPAFPILHVSSLVANIRAGYSFTEGSSVRQVEKAAVPMLFIHGSEDNFVHTEMVYEVYAACPTTKDLLIIEGAGHGEAYAMDPELYFDTVFGFVSANCIPE